MSDGSGVVLITQRNHQQRLTCRCQEHGFPFLVAVPTATDRPLLIMGNDFKEVGEIGIVSIGASNQLREIDVQKKEDNGESVHLVRMIIKDRGNIEHIADKTIMQPTMGHF